MKTPKPISDLTDFYRQVPSWPLAEVCDQHRRELAQALRVEDDDQVICSIHHLNFIEKELELRNIWEKEYTTERLLEIMNPSWNWRLSEPKTKTEK